MISELTGGADADESSDPPHDPLRSHANSSRVIREYAFDLSKRFEVAAQEVERGLWRLAETFFGERAEDAVVLADALHRPPLTMLSDALGVMPAKEAVRLILDADLIDLDRRVRMTAWLLSTETPLYSLDELAQALASLATDLHADREQLVKTGLPNRQYPGSTWLYYRLGRLYPTRQAASFVPYAERVSNPRPGVPPYTWLQSPHPEVNLGRDLRKCEYEQADFLPGLMPSDGLRVEADRGRLFDVKLRVIRRLAQALSEARAESLGADIMAILAGTLTAPEVEFYLKLDALGRRVDDPTNTDDSRSPGGLTALLEVAGHVEEELTVGRLKSARAALTGMIRTRLMGLIHGGESRESLAPRTIYLSIHSRPEQSALDAAIDAVEARRDRAAEFWQVYRQRLNETLANAFHTPLVIPLKVASEPTVAPLLQSYALFAEKELAAGRWVTAPPPGLCLFRWDDPSWTIAFEGKLIGKPHAVGLVSLQFLLQRPHRPFDVRVLRNYLHLWSKTPGLPFVDHSDSDAVIEALLGDGERGLTATTGRDIGEVADAEAVAAAEEYERRLPALIAEATTAGATMKAEELRAELMQVRKFLGQSRGLGNRPRVVSSDVKKARDAVVKAISEAVNGFEKSLPSLHQHLLSSLETGSSCCYRPTVPVNWQF